MAVVNFGTLVFNSEPLHAHGKGVRPRIVEVSNVCAEALPGTSPTVSDRLRVLGAEVNPELTFGTDFEL